MPGNAGVEAWEMWKTRVNMDDHLDLGSFRILPQLYRNLQNLGIDDPLMMKFKGIARQTWLKNQRLFHSTAPPLQALSEAGIDVLIFSGAALALRYYPDYVLSPATELTLLVRPAQALAALTQLQALGWTPVSPLPQIPIDAYIAAKPEHRFQDSTGHQVRLCWRFLPKYCPDDVDADSWPGAVAAQLQGLSVYILNPTDQLLYTCTQGAPQSTTSLFLRAIEAMLILKAAPAELDWSCLIVHAQKRWLRVPLIETLRYLYDELGAPIPPDVFGRLQATSTSKSEQFAYKLNNRRTTWWGRGLILWFNYVQCSEDIPWLRRIVGFPRFLKYYWRLDHLWQVPLHALSETRHQLRQSIRNGLFLPKLH